MPEALANKIAAGEVVQRPSSAVKELIENAIDAGATEVSVIVKSAGSELVQVVDDGCGMAREDAVACFLRHATSKIRSIEDLERIRTLGFRGEALASIAAVSQVELRTRRVEDAVGTLVRIDGGSLSTTEPVATAPGTSVAARHLFYNVPARRSFLKTPATEFKHVVDVFQSLALSNPGIGFHLYHQDAEVYRLPAADAATPLERLRFRVQSLLGDELADNLVDVAEETSYLSVQGFVSRPAYHRRSRGEQFLFVNERYVSNRYFEHAILSGYSEALPEGAFPFFALFLSLDPRHVDVNVHPSKAEVKFDDERGVYGFIRAVVRKALGTADLVPQLEDSYLPGYHRAPGEGALARATAGGPAPAGFAGAGGGSPFHGLTPGDLAERLYAPGHQEDEEGGILPSGAEPSSAETLEGAPGRGLLWQLHDRYILTQIRSGLMIADQNAAHERVIYEWALNKFENGLGMPQQLLFPQAIDFSSADFELLKEILPELRLLSFDIVLLSGRSVLVRGVPQDIRSGDERSLLEDILEQVKLNRERLRLKGRENLARSVARRSAIRPGQKLTEKEMRELIDRLFECEMPYACPNGRPTMVKISLDELDRRFGRARLDR